MLHAPAMEQRTEAAARGRARAAAVEAGDVATEPPVAGNQASLRRLGAPQLLRPSRMPMLQRTCACGGTCADCNDEKDGFQAKLAINEPGDEYEQEADRVADQVIRMPDPASAAGAQRKVEAASLQRCDPYSYGSNIDTLPPVVKETLARPGEALDGATRAYFEDRLGRDFGAVRVHTGAPAARAAEAVQAHAFTVGTDVVFAPGRYAPNSHDGRRLLAHELTHVVQQEAASRDAQATKRRALQRYSYDRNCSADTRSAIMGGYKLATWATKRAQLMLQAGSPTAAFKTWFDFLFGAKSDADATRNTIAGNFGTLNKALQEDYRFICPEEGTEYCKGNEARVDDDKNINICWARVKGFNEAGMTRLLVHETVRRAQGFRSVTDISNVDTGECKMGAYVEATTDANHPIPYSCFAEKLVSIYLPEKEQMVNALFENLFGNGLFTSWSGTKMIEGKAQPISAVLHVMLVDTSFALYGTYSYDKPDGGKGDGEIPFGVIDFIGPANHSEILLIEFAWREGSSTGMGVWRAENDTTLKGTWGYDQSSSDGGEWTLIVNNPQQEGKK